MIKNINVREKVRTKKKKKEIEIEIDRWRERDRTRGVFVSDELSLYGCDKFHSTAVKTA